MPSLKLAAFLGLTVLASADQCPPNAYASSFDGMCYVSGNASMAWGSAGSFCSSMGGQLIVPANAFDDNIVTTVMQQIDPLGTWLGLFSNDKGVWYDNTGKTISYTNWAAGEPSLTSSCALMMSDGFWYADYCDRKDRFICRMPPVAGPTNPPPTNPPVITTTASSVTVQGWPADCPGANASDPAPPCPKDWNFYLPTCSCYGLIAENGAWFDSEQTCVDLKSTLASVHSQDEAVFIKGMTETFKAYINIGLQNIGGQWVWTDGSPVDFLNWAPGQFQNNVSKYACGAILSDGFYFESYMANVPCKQVHAYSVCKKPLRKK